MNLWLLRLCLCFLCASTSAVAQLYPDSKGRDFWLTFLPNFHNNELNLPGDTLQQLEHQVYIYIGAEQPTKGTYTIRNIFGVSQTDSFSITDPTKLFEIRKYFDGIELRGENRGGTLNSSTSQAEKPAPQSIHIVSEAEVTVYAMNQARTTSDAFLVLPTDAITGDYVVMSYWSDINQQNPTNKTPSQFVVVATDNNTMVEITPSARTTFSVAGIPMTVVLQQGESFLVQTSLDGNLNSDLTGSVVRANKPVAVFGGQQRATLPIGVPGLTSRDCLIEQMSPVGTWGKSAFITPFARSTNEQDLGTDLFRVVAAFDSTAVMVDGTFQILMNAGQYFESALMRASEIKTSRPALVAQYKKTTGQIGLNNLIGDPLMMLVPPAEQFMNEYRFINVQSLSYEDPDNPVLIYTEQHLNIVVPTSGINGLVLDGLPVPPGRFQQLGQTEFSWAQVVMTDGVHHIKGDTTFGIYVYGYGEANSYGYIGGMAFRPLDTYPPTILGEPRCGLMRGTVADSLLGDSRVTRIDVVPGTENNVRMILGDFNPPQAVVEFQATLINPYDDGSIEIEATDAVGQTFRREFTVPGFTVGVWGRDAEPEPENRTMILPVGKERCDSVLIGNYGKYPITISVVEFSSLAQVQNLNLPLKLAPDSTQWVRYCRLIEDEGMTFDTLIVGDTCVRRKALAITMEAQLDKLPPAVQHSIDPCSTTVNIKVSDVADVDFGLESARLLTSVMVNCTATPDTSVPTQIVGHTVEWTITVVDPYQDAVYGFEAIDSAGNVASIIDTIPGFTLDIASVRGPYRTKQMQAYAVGELGCERVPIHNYGSFGITISGVLVVGNVLFSVPQHQFPIFIPPGASDSIEVCFGAIEADPTSRVDTLVFMFGCTDSRLVVFSEGTTLSLDGISRCNVPVGTNVRRIAPSGLLAAPLPAQSVLTLAFDRELTDATVRILDLTGVEIYRTRWQGAPTRGLAVNVEQVPPGSYVCVVESDLNVFSTFCVISR